MELITKMSILHEKLTKNGSVLVPVNLVHNFAVYCKMTETKTDAAISNDKYLFTLKN